MEAITLEAAQRSLSAAGYHFTTPVRQPEVEFVECHTNKRLPQMPVAMPSIVQYNIMEQTIVKQRHEMARLLLQERALRQTITGKDQRISQLEKRSRHQRQTRDLLVDLHLRIGKIEELLDLPQTAFSARQKAQVKNQYFDDGPPRLTAEQGN